MKSQVDASTIKAGAFFSERRLLVPDYQRKYSWLASSQVADFWTDLQSAVGREEYFLGLVILSQTPDRFEVVDGQQRIVTLTILANALRLSALELRRRLVAESLRTDFLSSMDYEAELQVPRVVLTDPDDQRDLDELLEADENASIQLRDGSRIHAAHQYLSEALAADLQRHDNAAIRIGQWAEFITKDVTFAVFMHPDRAAAFRVFEVINTRGMVLTPTELIKSYLIGNSGAAQRDDTNTRWRRIERQLESVGGSDQFTTFVRHVVTLDRGYITPRELYREVSEAYAGTGGVAALLDKLERWAPLYMQLIDPSSDVESSETRSRSFAIADVLSLTRFRPILMLASVQANADALLESLMKILIPGSITGQFGTGSIEAQFARAARRLHEKEGWESELSRLGELKPLREELRLRLSKNLSKQQALVIRSTYLQKDSLPSLITGFPHQIRPANGVSWPGFDASAYEEAGSLAANWILTSIERRPTGARTPDLVRERLLPHAIADEVLSDPRLSDWNIERVKLDTEAVSEAVAEQWYGDH